MTTNLLGKIIAMLGLAAALVLTPGTADAALCARPATLAKTAIEAAHTAVNTDTSTVRSQPCGLTDPATAIWTN